MASQLKVKSDLYDIRSILTSKCAARRSQNELQIIQTFLSTRTSINQFNSIWSLLSLDQRVHLCAYFQYRKLDSSGELIYLNQHTASKDSKLFIILKGTATLTYQHRGAGNQNDSIDLSHGTQCIAGDCFGAIYINHYVQEFISTNATMTPLARGQVKMDDDEEEESSPTNDTEEIKWRKRGRQSILVLPKGCHYIYLCSTDIRHYIDTIVDDLVSSIALKRIHLGALYNSEKKKFMKFPKGHQICIEGMKPEKVFFLILSGTAELRKYMPCVCEKQQKADEDAEGTGPCIATKELNVDDTNSVRIGHARALSFVGFMNHFLDLDRDDTRKNETSSTKIALNKNLLAYHCIARTEMRVMVLDAYEVISMLDSNKRRSVKLPNDRSEAVLDCFHKLAKKQQEWLLETFPSICKEMDASNISFKDALQRLEQVDLPTSNVEDMVDILSSHTKKYKLLDYLKRELSTDESIFHHPQSSTGLESKEMMEQRRQHGFLMPIPLSSTHGKALTIRASYGYCEPLS